MNKLKELRLSNNKLDKKLTKENSIIMTDIVCYLRSSDIYDEQIEEIRQDLLAMFLDAQEHSIDIHERIGSDFKVFCDEIIANTPKKTRSVKIIEMMEIISFEILILTISMVLFNIDFMSLYEKGLFKTTLSIPFISLVIYVILLIIPVFIFEYITKTSLKKQRKKTMKRKTMQCITIGIVCGISVFICTSLLRLTDEVMIPLLTILLIIAVSFICYILLNMLVQLLHKKHIQMTKTM